MQLEQEIKQTAHRIIDNLPDDTSWEKLLYTLQIRYDIEAGLAESDANQVVSSAELRQQLGINSA
ncbi:MAG: hypothetical protein OXE97_09135 [Gammaproteobacteria bacterium]|nr:hypothetical protein [Gammaproteobacteria bacterium]MCY4211188.1 hypothetical protein [Gammaproteobacteria bacterium]MCY4282132.1 hypothetical protein [Gammaproteobacteria bacterium]